ncbi:MAG TPA: PAS domain S-box protein [candidate division Zixibacteria bacterium]|nr:PAS domain S-box protein [candidate division Zixibacteria bacterium]
MKNDDYSVGGEVEIVSCIEHDNETSDRESLVNSDSDLLTAANKVLTESLKAESVEEVANLCLEVAEKVTGSSFGFIGELNDNNLLDTVAVSNPGWEACSIDRSSAVRMLNNMKLRGLWANPLKHGCTLMTNEPSSHPDSIGVPKGHPGITTFLGVPIFRGEESVGVIALANKPGGYNGQDARIIEKLSPVFCAVLDRKKQQIALEKAHASLRRDFSNVQQDYQSIVENMLIGLITTDLESRVQFANATACRLFDRKQLEGSYLYDIYDEPEQWQKMINDLKRSGAVHGVIHKLKLGNDLKRWIQVSASLTGSTVTKLVVDVSKNVLADVRYQAMLEATCDGFCTSTMAVEMTDVNEALCQMLGYNRRELLGTRLSDYKVRKDPEETAQHIDSVAKNGFDRFKIDLRKRDGSVLHAELSAIYVTEGGGSFAIFIRDISNELRLQEELKQSEERLTLALNGTEDGIWDWNLITNEIFYSPRWKGILGYSDEELADNYDIWEMLLHPEDLSDAKKSIDDYLKGQSDSYRAEFRMQHKDGTWKNILSRGKAVVDPKTGQNVRFVGVHSDVTEQRRYQRAIERQHRQFLALLDNFPEVLYVSDPDTHEVIFTNRKLTGLLGGDVVGQKCYKALQGFDTPCSFCTNHIIKEQPKEPYTWDYYNERLNRHYFISDQIIRWPDGRDVRMELAIDITERKESEEKLKAMTEKLKRSNTELEKFAYVASHDLQEPLRMVGSYLQLIQRRYQGQLDENADDFINYAVDGANRMKKMINDLLEISRVTTRGEQFAEFDSQELMDRVLHSVERLIEDTGAEVNVAPLPVIMGDESQLGMLFQNLVINGIKFHGEESPRLKIEVEQIGYNWHFIFEDNGIGIEEQYHQKIFEIFQRLNSRETYEGTGIGLALCQKIVYRHGGRIWVESELNHGSRFHVELPLKPKQSETSLEEVVKDVSNE